MHDREENILYAILAGINKKVLLEKKWKVAATRFGPKLKDEQEIYFCVPLKKKRRERR